MRKWQKEQLIRMRDAVTDLMVFIGDQKIGRMPRAYFLLDNMRNNIEIFVITSGEQEQDFYTAYERSVSRLVGGK